MADLITEARAKQNINQATFTPAETTTILALIAAVSAEVRKLCRRQFDAQNFDQLYDGRGYPRLLLREYPIISITRVAGNPTVVLSVTNTAPANARATVAVTSTGLTLTHIASGVTTTNTLTFAASPTLAALAAAITALGSGWSATAAASYTTWASADLRAPQGARGCKDRTADLCIHTEDLADYDIVEDRGIITLRTGPATPGPAWFGDEQDWPAPVFVPGRCNYRVIYRAGFSTVPEAVQEACAQWVAALYWNTKRDPSAHTESVPGSMSRQVKVPPDSALQMLKPYVKPC